MNTKHQVFVMSVMAGYSGISQAELNPSSTIMNYYLETPENVKEENYFPRRVDYETAVLNGVGVTPPDEGNPVTFYLSNEQLSRGIYVPETGKLQTLKEIFGSGEFDVSVRMDSPFSAVDCKSIANQLYDNESRDTTVVNCLVSASESVSWLNEQVRHQSPRYQYSLSEYVDDVFCIPGRGPLEPVCKGGYRHYDLRSYAVWSVAFKSENGSAGEGDASGSWYQERSDFDYSSGWIPVDVGGITTFIKGTVKKSEPWRLVNSDHTLSGDYNSKGSGRRFYFDCGSNLFMKGWRVTSGDDDTEASEQVFTNTVVASTATQMDDRCGSGVVIRMENLRADKQLPVSDDVVDFAHAIVKIESNAPTMSPRVAASHYVDNMTDDLRTLHSRVWWYKSWMDSLESIDAGEEISAEAQQLLNARSSQLQSLMNAYANISVEVSPEDVNKLFYSPAEVGAIQDSLALLVNVENHYKLALQDAIKHEIEAIGNEYPLDLLAKPEWYSQFEEWVSSLSRENLLSYLGSTAYSENLDMQYDPISIVADLEVTVGAYIDSEMGQSHTIYLCEYAKNWRTMTDKISQLEQFEWALIQAGEADNPIFTGATPENSFSYETLTNNVAVIKGFSVVSSIQNRNGLYPEVNDSSCPNML